jgi:hypothetical protein
VTASSARARCIVFFPDGWVGVSPTVLALLEHLAGRGYAVTIYAYANPLPKPGSLPAGVEIVYFRRPSKVKGLARAARALRDRGANPVVTSVDSVAYVAAALGRAAAQRLVGSRPVCIGVDRMGALAALTYRRLTGAPYLWLSLELQDREYERAGDGLARRLYGASLREAEAVVIQDEARLETAVRLFGAEPRRVFLVPNGPSGSAVAPSEASENFFRDRFGTRLDAYPYIALHAGAIIEDFYALEIARGFAPVDGWALVCHERVRRDEDEPFLREVRTANPRNLFLSLDPVPYEEIDKPYAAATIGLAFYRPLNDDLSEIALASGKLAFYLKHGKPVLMNDLPSFRRLLQRYPFGVTVSDPSHTGEVRDALARLIAGYDGYATQARRCFTEVFDASRTALPVIELLDSLSGRAGLAQAPAATSVSTGETPA